MSGARKKTAKAAASLLGISPAGAGKKKAGIAPATPLEHRQAAMVEAALTAPRAAESAPVSPVAAPPVAAPVAPVIAAPVVFVSTPVVAPTVAVAPTVRALAPPVPLPPAPAPAPAIIVRPEPVTPSPQAQHFEPISRADREPTLAAPIPPPPTLDDIVAYWDAARNGRRFPAWPELDAKRIGDNWPESLLLECVAGSGRGRQVRGMSRLGKPSNGSVVAYTSSMIEWILSLAGEVASTGEAIEDTEEFRSPEGAARYRAILLPLGSEAGGVDRVLGSIARG
jgi:hypothetical protein